ncbi:MAG: glycoside hydrolase family 5 protein [Balneolales bacterium]|nr:glycoside hydrolase family 5 protein [Balneolales bacterium]
MNSRFITIISIAILFFSACNVSSSNSGDIGINEPLDPFEQNIALGRGINLGNALEAPTEGEWGVVLQEDWFTYIKNAGFSSVRIPIRWSAHTSDGPDYTIDSIFFERVDWAIEQALANDLMVIINIHHYEEIFSDPLGEREKFFALWKQIAERYKNQPKEVLFEILNEPHAELTADLWNLFLPEALQIIREDNPYRTVVIGAAEWGGIPGLLKLEIPDDGNLIVTVHYYEPFQFTHQGAEWVDNSDPWLGTTWDGTQEEVDAVNTHFQQIVDWATERNVPINIGEFGAYSKADSDSRARWTEAIVRFALQNDMSYHYWEFASGFGIYNPENGDWDVVLLRALTETVAN